MSRDYRTYLDDILNAIGRIGKYTRGMTLKRFKADTLVQDAVVRNLEVIGEATGKLPKRYKDMSPEIEWRSISGMRNILAHEYFGVDIEIVWQVTKKKLPALRKTAIKLSDIK